MKSLSNPAVEGNIRVVEDGLEKKEGSVLIATLGTDISVDTRLLDEYCFSKPSDLTYDLTTLVGAVRYADRAVLRKHSKSWERKLNLEIPVFEKAIWTNSEVQLLLQDCLGFLTGDAWHFTFKKRKKRPESSAQSHAIRLPEIPHVFVPYSHGLDSYAQMRILEHKERDVAVVCVHTDSKRNAQTWKELCKSKVKGGVRALQVPVRVAEPKHAEPSFRSRPFMYYMFSAYGAFLSGAHRVLIPENGQGSLDGSLVPLGNESLHRSCHPGFTLRLSRLLEKITGEFIRFEHPALFQTKGEVLAELAVIDNGSALWLQDHWSCSHDQRHGSYGGRHLHCGACGNCLLRRVSISAAGIIDTTDYKFSDLTAEKLELALGGHDEVPRHMKSFRDLSGNSARSMQRLADLADEAANSFIWAEAASLSNNFNLDVKTAHSRLMSLLQSHQLEWTNFLNGCGSRSWLFGMARG